MKLNTWLIHEAQYIQGTIRVNLMDYNLRVLVCLAFWLGFFLWRYLSTIFLILLLAMTFCLSKNLLLRLSWNFMFSVFTPS